MNARRARAIRIDVGIGFAIAFGVGIWRSVYLGGGGTQLLIVAVVGGVILSAIYAMIWRYTSRASE